MPTWKMVVEYKGKAYATNDDSKEKKLLGQLWECRSKGTALFLMAEKRDKDGRDLYQQLEQKVRAT
jgi:type III restriction enzyme